MPESNRPIPDLLLERFVLGELPQSQMKEISLRAENDPQLQSRIDAILKSNEEILDELPPEKFSESLQGKLEQNEPANQARPQNVIGFPKTWMGAIAALVIIGILSPVLYRMSIDPQSTSGDRIKGGPTQLYVYRKNMDQKERLQPGSMAEAGDRIQLAYTAPGGYGAVFSVDGNGVVTRHHPLEGEQAVKLETGGIHPLEVSYELDDAPDFERFYLMVAKSPFNLEQAEQSLRQDARPGNSLKLNVPVGVVAFELRKKSQ